MIWTNPFPFQELLATIFHFYSNFDRTFCQQTVEILIRRRFCGVGSGSVLFAYRCPTIRTLGLYGLTLYLLGLFMILSYAVFFQNELFFRNSFRNTIKVSNSLDPDQARHFVGPDLDPNCLQKYQLTTHIIFKKGSTVSLGNYNL